jgi:PAS domain S-box-containing protein
MFEHFLRTVHPDDIHLISSIQKSSFTENQSKTVNLRIILPGGIIKWLQTDIKAIYDQGVVVALKGVSIDITEKRKAEEYIAKQNSRLNSIISAMPDLIFVLDKEGVYREVYCSTPEILLIPPAQIVGTSMFSVFDEEMASMHHQYLLTCLNEKRLVTYEYTLGSKDDLRYYESRLAPVEEDHVLSLVRDITVTKHAEAEILNLNASLEEKIRSRTAQLAETNDQLLIEINQRRQVEADLLVTVGIAEKANNAKSEFLSRMSHELRTPMNAILGYAQLMNMGELTASQKKGVDYILKSGRHLLDLINEVLDIAGIEAGRITLALKPVMVTEILSESIALILPLAKEKEITISVIPSADMNLSVLSDRQRLNQVMINLLDNAIKYNRINGQITILTERITRDGVDAETVRISITDTGIGIAGGDLDKLFNPFERLGAENTYIEGTGLGLAVVKRLLEAMNGKIGVISDTDAGSTFWIELPLGETRLEQEPKQQDHPVKSISASDYTGTIMYIEDNLSNIDLIDQILMTARPNVRMISNMLGKYAVELAMEHKPDVIFLDLNLPDTDGFEVMKLLLEQEKTRNIPVVIISADAMPHQITRLLEAGADNYFTKPIDIGEFLKEVDKWVGK